MAKRIFIRLVTVPFSAVKEDSRDESARRAP